MLEREFQKKRKIRNRIYSKTTVVILAIVALILIKPTWNVYKTKVESKRSLERVSAEFEQLREKEAQLTADIERLNTAKGTEEEIREKFNVSKEGESVVFIVDPKQNELPPEEKKGFFKRMWGGVTGWFK